MIGRFDLGELLPNQSERSRESFHFNMPTVVSIPIISKYQRLRSFSLSNTEIPGVNNQEKEMLLCCVGRRHQLPSQVASSRNLFALREVIGPCL